jgi:hypothetical protein
MSKYSLVEESNSHFRIHDGEEHFDIAKHPLEPKMQAKIRALPKYADGGKVEEKSFLEDPIGVAQNKAVDLYNKIPSDFYQKGVQGAVDLIGGPTGTALAKHFTPGLYQPVEQATVNPQPLPQPEQATQGPAPASETPPAPATVPTTPAAPNLVQQYQANQKLAEQGLRDQAAAQQQMAKEQQDIYGKVFKPEDVENLNKQLAETQAKKAKLDQESEKLFNDSLNGTIDPNRLWNNKSTGSKVLATIGLILGGAGAHSYGGRNIAAEALDNAINKDIESQKSAKENARSLFNLNRERYRDTVAAEQATYIHLNAAMQGQLAAAAARAQNPMIKAQLEQNLAALKDKSLIVGQELQQRQLALDVIKNPNVTPEQKIRFGVPQAQQEFVYKELKDAQNLKDLHEEGMKVFDEVSKLNTLGNQLSIDKKRQIEGIRDAFLDKLTKDVSGRVTPETVHLVQGVFSKPMNSEETVAKLRQNMHNFLLQKSAFPVLSGYNINPIDEIKIYRRPAGGAK